MDFVIGGGDGGNGGLGSDNGPILYNEPNRTSAIDDIRSVVIYIFIITIFVSFFLILPGIRNEKFPTFLCITTSLIVTSILLVSLFGTTWHIGEAPISAAYKAFSRDRIQGELSVKIGLRSVNITLLAHKYYILHAIHGPMIMDNTLYSSIAHPSEQSQTSSLQRESLSTVSSSSSGAASSFINIINNPTSLEVESSEHSIKNLGDELLGGRTSDGSLVDTELEVEEVFPSSSTTSSSSSFTPNSEASSGTIRRIRSSHSNSTNNETIRESLENKPVTKQDNQIKKRSTQETQKVAQKVSKGQKFTIKRVNVDINYNERFYWIEPDQMRQEHQSALKRGLPFPILTVVEYLSQDEAGFSWSRQYRLAGYYSNIIIWLALCLCALMFFLHCAAPKYGIYTMQLVGCLMLFTNLTYASLVPSGKQKLVIPFEGQALTFQFGWNFWLVFVGGCLSLIVGSIIVLIDCIYPNFIFTTILDVDFDSHHKYSYKQRRKQKANLNGQSKALERPVKPPFLENSTSTTKVESSSSDLLSQSSSSDNTQHGSQSSGFTSNASSEYGSSELTNSKLRTRQHLIGRNRANIIRGTSEKDDNRKGVSYLNELFLNPATGTSKNVTVTIDRETARTATSDSEVKRSSGRLENRGQSSSVVEMVVGDGTPTRTVATTSESSDTFSNLKQSQHQLASVKSTNIVNSQDHYSSSKQIDNKNLTITDHQVARKTSNKQNGKLSKDTEFVRL